MLPFCRGGNENLDQSRKAQRGGMPNKLNSNTNLNKVYIFYSKDIFLSPSKPHPTLACLPSFSLLNFYLCANFPSCTHYWGAPTVIAVLAAAIIMDVTLPHMIPHYPAVQPWLARWCTMPSRRLTKTCGCNSVSYTAAVEGVFRWTSGSALSGLDSTPDR